MSKVLGVGTTGASAQRGWATDSHVPVVRGLAEVELVAVAAGEEQKAKDAAKAFGARLAMRVASTSSTIQRSTS